MKRRKGLFEDLADTAENSKTLEQERDIGEHEILPNDPEPNPWDEEPAERKFEFNYEEALRLFQREAWVGVLGRYGKRIEQTPLHWMSGYAMLSARCSRNFSFLFPYPHYAMNYCLMLVRTGSGKSTAMSYARTAVNGSTFPVTLIDGVQSAQALAENLARWEPERNILGKETKVMKIAEVYKALLWEPEFTRLMQQMDMKSASMLQELCRVYDAEDFFSVRRVARNGGAVIIPRPQLSVLSASTETVFRAALTDAHALSGLMSRFLIFVVDGTEKGLLPKDLDWSSLVNFGNSLTCAYDMIGPATVDQLYEPKAWKMYEMYHERTKFLDNDAYPHHAWFSRCQAHFHRIALLLTYYEGELVIREEFAIAAFVACSLWIASVLRFVDAVPDLIPTASLHQEHSWARKWLFQYLAEVPPIAQRILQKKCYKLKNGKEKWSLVKEEIEKQVQIGTVKDSWEGKARSLSLVGS